MRVFILLCVAIGLSACDPIYGVAWRATLNTEPQISCVEDVIKGTPGVADVRYQYTEGSRPLTLTGVQLPDKVHSFLFAGAEGSHIGGAVQIISHYDGTAAFDETLLWMGEPPPQEDVDATVPVMQSIEARLEARCNLSPNPLEIHKNCTGVRCTPST